MLSDRFGQLSNFLKEKLKKILDIQVRTLNVLQGTSWGRPESTYQGRPLNVRLGHPLDIISGRPQDVRSGHPREGQIGSLRDVLGTLKGDVLGTSWRPIFAGWVLTSNKIFMGIKTFIDPSKMTLFFITTICYLIGHYQAEYAIVDFFCCLLIS